MRLVFKQTAAALLMAALAACTPAAPSVAPAVAPPPAAAPAAEAKAEPAAPARPTAESTPSYAGEVRSAASLTVVPRVSGRVEKLYVEVGAAVKAGDRI